MEARNISKGRVAIRQAAPSWEPVTLEQAKEQVRVGIESTDHDEYLTRLIQQAREQFEHDTSYVCATGTFVMNFDRFENDFFELPLRPVTAVSSITYIDFTGATNTWPTTEWHATYSTAMTRVYRKYLKLWPPTARGHRDDITVTFTAGHATAADVPEAIKQAILLEVKNQFESADVSKMTENYGYTVLSNRFARPTYP